jgi:hypothetical protein
MKGMMKHTPQWIAVLAKIKIRTSKTFVSKPKDRFLLTVVTIDSRVPQRCRDSIRHNVADEVRHNADWNPSFEQNFDPSCGIANDGPDFRIYEVIGSTVLFEFRE